MGGHEQNDITKQGDKLKAFVIEKITSFCTLCSSIDEFKAIGLALQEERDELYVECVSGGLANLSHKVFLNKHPNLALYAKLSFPYALWNPDRSRLFDVERTANEFKMMQLFSSMAPGCVANPYACVDVDDMKLLVAQWTPANEHWASQMIDGEVDMRLPRKLSVGLSKLHCSEFDPEFNNQVRPYLLSMFPIMQQIFFHSLESSETDDRCVALAKEYGKDVCDTFMASMIKNFNDRDCLIHSDLHVFNVLVEKNSSEVGNTSQKFGDNGTLVLCDWEFSKAGPIGRDLGYFHGFPLACVICHALNGRKSAVEKVLVFLDAVWEEYYTAMVDVGKKSDEFMCATFRNIIAWTGWAFLLYLSLDVHMAFLPINQENAEEKAKVRESLGVLMLKFLRWGFADFEPHLSLNELRQRFKDAIKTEIEIALFHSTGLSNKEDNQMDHPFRP